MMGRLATCERGTASVEAVVILPFLVLLFAGALYVHALAAAHQQSDARARQCAWAHALAGCPDTPPPSCGGEGTEAPKGGTGGADALAQVGVNSADFTQKLGFLGGIVEGFLGHSFVTTRSAEVQALMAPDEHVEVSASQVMLCNPSPPSFGGFLKKIFNARDRIGSGG